jgi:hypothetical protein
MIRYITYENARGWYVVVGDEESMVLTQVKYEDGRWVPVKQR